MSIRLEQLTKRYEGRPVVSNVSLEVAEGELCVLLGPSGSGKSTILRLIAGLAAPDSGSIRLGGRDLAGVPAQKRGCGFVFQSYALFRRMTVAENVEFALRIRRVSRAERRERRDELLELVGLAGLGGRLPAQLSGGQQQRVALARALAHRPEILLLDEPFGALDARIRLDLRRGLQAIQRELGVTTLFVTHDQEEAFELGDRIAVLSQGRLVEEGPPDELYLRPQTEFVAVFLGGANLWVGESTASGVRLGPVEVPLAGPVRGEGEHRRVQVLVRPEDVAVRGREDELREPPLGRAEVVETSFSGAVERLRLRMPAPPGVRVIHPPPPFGDEHLAIDAVRAQHVARREPLRPGDPVWVGVRRLHALLHPGLAFVALGEEARGYAGDLARLAQARLDTVERVESLRARLERAPADLVVARLGAGGADDAEDLLERARGAHLLLLRGANPLPPQRFLIAVAVGEPGKEDVDFVGRLARHLGSPATVLTALALDAGPGEVRAAERFLAACVRTLGRWGVRAEPEPVRGELAPIVERRMRADHDLLVVGSPLADDEGRLRWGRSSRALLEAGGSHPVLIVRGQGALRPGWDRPAETTTSEERGRLP
jgi:sulfate transport system ATP-binding protein